MIAVDASVWIDHLNDAPTGQTTLLREIISAEREIIVVGDLVLTEILQGLATEREAVRVASALRRFEVMPMVGEDIAVKFAANYRVFAGQRGHDPKDHRSSHRHVLHRAWISAAAFGSGLRPDGTSPRTDGREVLSGLAWNRPRTFLSFRHSNEMSVRRRRCPEPRI